MEEATACSLLLVDDDAELGALMTAYLTPRGYRLTCEYDGVAGLRTALNTRYDLVILDLMLPKLGGFEVLRQLRRRSAVPVLMLTARVDERDRIDGLETGADDYLVKPFSIGELLARVRALLRRAGHRSTRTRPLDVGGLHLNPDTREASYGSLPLPLTSLEFSLLELLMQSAGRVVSREEISAVLFQREPSPYERSLDVHISNLRKKLESRGGDVIRTVRGVGYLLAASD